MTGENEFNTQVPGEMASSESQQGEDQGKNTEFVSKNDFDKAFKDLQEESRRQAQSYSMQAENRINKTIQKGLADLQTTINMQREMGLEIPADKIQAMENRIIANAYRSEDQKIPGSQAQPMQSQPMAQQSGNAMDDTPDNLQGDKASVIAEMRGMAEVYGYTIDRNDPEMSDLAPFLQASTPGVEVKKAFAKALKAKQSRLQTQGVARGFNAVSGSPAGNDLMAQYQKEKAKLPRGNVKTQHELRMKYIGKGLTGI